jgi:two-component system response regulator DevR
MPRPRLPVGPNAAKYSLDRTRALPDRVRDGGLAMARVVVIEDDPYVQRALMGVFRGKAEVAVYGSLATASAHDREPRDAMIVDHRLPDGDGLAYARTIAPRFPQIPIILFTGSDYGEVGRETNELGIIFASKPDGIAHVHRLAARMEALGSGRASTAVRRRGRLDDHAKHWRLSARELDAARFALDDPTREAMARRLGIEEGSVKNLVTRLLKKCGLTSLDELVSFLDRM